MQRNGFRFRLVALASMILVGLCSSQAKAQDSATYFPLKAGGKWTYRIGEKGQVVHQIAKVENIDGLRLSRMEIVLQGVSRSTEHLSMTPEGVFRHRYNGLEVNPPVCLVKTAAKNGETWSSTHSIGGQSVQLTCTATVEDVKVPAGSYRALAIKTKAKDTSGEFTNTSWFVPNVGIVKQVHERSNQSIVLELEKYEPAS